MPILETLRRHQWQIAAFVVTLLIAAMGMGLTVSGHIDKVLGERIVVVSLALCVAVVLWVLWPQLRGWKWRWTAAAFAGAVIFAALGTRVQLALPATLAIHIGVGACLALTTVSLWPARPATPAPAQENAAKSDPTSPAMAGGDKILLEALAPNSPTPSLKVPVASSAPVTVSKEGIEKLRQVFLVQVQATGNACSYLKRKFLLEAPPERHAALVMRLLDEYALPEFETAYHGLFPRIDREDLSDSELSELVVAFMEVMAQYHRIANFVLWAGAAFFGDKFLLGDHYAAWYRWHNELLTVIGGVRGRRDIGLIWNSTHGLVGLLPAPGSSPNHEWFLWDRP